MSDELRRGNSETETAKNAKNLKLTKWQKQTLRDGIRRCRVCGCREERPCITATGACSWVEEDLCSACSLKPCPFCGGPASIKRYKADPPDCPNPWWVVLCQHEKKCHASVTAIGDTRAEAGENWNRRDSVIHGSTESRPTGEGREG
jgi:Restriction alleviation protein Lar